MSVQSLLVFALVLALGALWILVGWVPNSNPFPNVIPLGCAQTVSINGHSINVELAQTPKEQEQGLMERASLEKNQGMLFLFALPGTYSFWMKNTLIPLDIVFLDSGKRIVYIVSALPCKEALCPSFTPPKPVQFVLEVPGSAAHEFGWKAGDQALFQLCNETS
ncbi:MAG: DUF192 domain-containing protein [Candidatus Diapherotrites archaeon]|nr:DUF192 domain-containing protein [Candidatus Diapherotrites archaeon]